MINENKILDYLQNDLKIPLYKVEESHQIIIKSPISNIKSLIEFIEPLHYYLSYVCGCIYINPKLSGK